jgi:hypothetical protein
VKEDYESVPRLSRWTRHAGVFDSDDNNHHARASWYPSLLQVLDACFTENLSL